MVLTYNALNLGQIANFLSLHVPVGNLRSSSASSLSVSPHKINAAFPAFCYCASNIWNNLTETPNRLNHPHL